MFTCFDLICFLAEKLCMLNGTTVFSIPNIPKTAPIVLLYVFFAFAYKAVVSGKGMAALQIIPSKNKTIARLNAGKFPAYKCAGGSVETEFVSIRTVAYIIYFNRGQRLSQAQVLNVPSGDRGRRHDARGHLWRLIAGGPGRRRLGQRGLHQHGGRRHRHRRRRRRRRP